MPNLDANRFLSISIQPILDCPVKLIDLDYHELSEPFLYLLEYIVLNHSYPEHIPYPVVYFDFVIVQPKFKAILSVSFSSHFEVEACS